MRSLSALAFTIALAGCATAAGQQGPAPVASTPEPTIEYRFSPFFMFDMDENFTAGVDLADIDGDGDLDILLANGRHWAQQDYAYLNIGDGRVLEARPIGTTLGASYLVSAGDLDGDGDIDAINVRDMLPIQVFHNNGQGAFSLAHTLPDSAGAARSGLLADVDADGALDYVVARRGGTSALFRGDGSGDFHPGQPLPGPVGGATGIAAADIDADGDLDLAIACRDGSPSFILINDNNTFTARPIEGSAGDHRNVLLADFTGDGLIDAVLGSTQSPNELYTGDGAGGFTLTRTIDPTARETQSLEAADLDKDGDIDIVEGVIEANNLVHFNNGDGTFTAVELPDTEADTYDIAIADMNGDGFPDLVFANSQAPNMILRASPARSSPVRPNPAR